MHGQGTMYLYNNEYSGEWKDGKLNGQVTLTLYDGKKYEGESNDEKMNGQGNFIHSNYIY